MEKKIKELENSHATNPTDNIFRELQKYKTELNNLLNKTNKFLIERLRLNTSQNSNKSNTYLANMVKQKKDTTTITVIKDSAGKPYHNPKDINTVFKNYYQDLYTSSHNPNASDIHQFLNNINLPHLTTEQTNLLEQPITPAEFHNALNKMENNRAPGPDGFPAEFYKHFWSTISPLFLRMIDEFLITNSIPPMINTAVITLLLKPDKDPTHLSSYRPLSLLNTDIKIISKALSNRIEKVIPFIIHPDQTGFIKGRQSSYNTRKLFNLMQLSNNKKTETIILSLDAQKAFDRVNWSFLFTTLQKFGFGESFINWIKALYISPTATITTNGLTSQQFTLHNGTRQGCPLSPSLFAIFLELAASKRQNNNIKGIRSISTEHKTILYADDVLIFLQEPYSSLQECLSVIKSFSSLSNYSINLSKSTILPHCMDQKDMAALTLQFHLQIGNIKYLGIHISPSCRSCSI